jgi:hypothetical protein
VPRKTVGVNGKVPAHISWKGRRFVMSVDRTMMIERRTREDVVALLKEFGFGKVRTKRWKDYENAKKVCFEGLPIIPEIYERQLGWISDYLKL